MTYGTTVLVNLTAELFHIYAQTAHLITLKKARHKNVCERKIKQA